MGCWVDDLSLIICFKFIYSLTISVLDKYDLCFNLTICIFNWNFSLLNVSTGKF